MKYYDNHYAVISVKGRDLLCSYNTATKKAFYLNRDGSTSTFQINKFKYIREATMDDRRDLMELSTIDTFILS